MPRPYHQARFAFFGVSSISDLDLTHSDGLRPSVSLGSTQAKDVAGGCVQHSDHCVQGPKFLLF